MHRPQQEPACSGAPGYQRYADGRRVPASRRSSPTEKRWSGCWFGTAMGVLVVKSDQGQGDGPSLSLPHTPSLEELPRAARGS